MKKFLKEYRLEIIVLLIALLFIILLTEGSGLRKGIWYAGWAASIQLKKLFESGASGINTMVSRFGVFDFVSLVILLAATGFVGFRVRNRILQSDSWRSSVCPRCGGSLHRAHRSALDRLLITFFLLEGKRYRCSNCKWSGLKRA